MERFVVGCDEGGSSELWTISEVDHLGVFFTQGTHLPGEVIDWFRTR